MPKALLAAFLGASVGAAFLSCGGKTEVSDGVNAEGGAAGSGGTGGRGGTAGRGGSAGVGGTAGVGGVSGSSGAAGNGGGSASSLIDAVCAATRAAGCRPDDCEGFLSQTLRRARAAGCASMFVSALDCLLGSGSPCGGGAECETLIQMSLTCEAGNCTVSSSLDGRACSLACPGWQAECNPSPEPTNCVCTRGLRTGRAFSAVPCESLNWDAQPREFCGPPPP